MKKAMRAIVCLSLLAALFAGCAQSAESDKILFGAALPLTGNLVTEGKKHEDGYNLWMKEVNKKGGIEINGKKHLVEIKYYDYKSDTATAVKLVEKLITEDNVRLIFGPMGSGAAKAVGAVTEKYKVPMIAPTASSDEVFSDGRKYLFGTFTPNRTLTEPLADLVMAKANPPKTIAIVARNDLFPLAIGNEAKISAEKRGIRIVAFDQYPVGATDLAPMLIRLTSANPDWVFVTGYANDLILARKQMQELGIKPKMITMIAGAVYQEFIDGTGDISEGVTSACWWHNNVTYQGEDIFGTAANFTKLYEAEYGYRPDYTCATSSAVAIIFQKAIETCQSTDPDKVRDAIAAMDFVTFFGPIKFDARGMSSALNPPILQIKGGKHIPVFPREISGMDLEYPLQY
jgi:branched-chain amino acid transport system substrate-binding protein